MSFNPNNFNNDKLTLVPSSTPGEHVVIDIINAASTDPRVRWANGDLVFKSTNASSDINLKADVVNFLDDLSVKITASIPTWWIGTVPGLEFSSAISSGYYVVATSDSVGDVQSASVALLTGSNNAVGATWQTGEADIATGQVSDPGATANTGLIQIYTGDNAGSGVTGDVNIASGTSSGGGDTGDISLITGATSGTRGKIRFQDGTEGTAGYVWTSTDVNGNGAWVASGTAGANTSLSNLIATSINQDLLPDTDLSKNLGSSLKEWLKAFVAHLTIEEYNSPWWGDDVSAIKFDSSSLPQSALELVTTDAATGHSGAVVVRTGDNTGTTGQAGGMYHYTGNVTNALATLQTGDNEIVTGDNAGSGFTGNITLRTGGANSGTSGVVELHTGNSSSNDSGYIELKTGTAGGTRGAIKFKNGSEGTAGYIWTAMGVDGEGAWQPAPAAGANTALSNLLTTAINADLLPNLTDTRALGSVANYWLSGHINSIVTKNLALTKADDSNDYFYLTDSAPNWWTTASPGILFQSGIGENDYAIVTSDGSGSARSADIAVVTGSNGSASGLGTGDIFVVSGAVTNASSTAQTGGVVLYTGDNAGLQKSGDIEIYTGAATGGGDTGRIAIETSDSTSGDSGPIQFRTGSAPGGVRGKLRFMDGSEGTAGYIWTSTDTLGHGTWMAAPVTGANTSLSNLIPTSINQSLMPDTDFAWDIGAHLNKWNEIYAYQHNGAGVQLLDYDGSAPFQDVGRLFINTSFNGETTPNVTLKTIGPTDSYTTGPVLAIGSDNNFGGEVLIATADRNINLNSGNLRLRTGTVSGTGVRGNVVIDAGNQVGALVGTADNSLVIGRPDTKVAEIYTWGTNSYNFTSWDWDFGPSGNMLGNLAPNELVNGLSGSMGLVAHNTADGTTPDYGLVIGTGNAVLGGIYVATDTKAGATPSGSLELTTGETATGLSGAIDIYTGLSSGGNTGGVGLGSGDAGTGDISGSVNIFTGNATSGTSGSITLNTSAFATTRGTINLVSDKVKIFNPNDVLVFDNAYTDSYWATPQIALVAHSAWPNPNGNFFIGTTDHAITGEFSHSVTIWSGYASNGASSGIMQFASGYVTDGAGNSGVLEIFSGDVVDGISGPVNISTGLATGTGSRSAIGLSADRVIVYTQAGGEAIFFKYNYNDVNYWGDEVASIIAPSTVPNNSNAFHIATGDLNVDSSTHDMSLTTGANEFNTTAGKRTGDLYLQTGVILDGAGTSGAIFLVSGYNDDSGSTGLVRLSSGEGNGTGNTGSITTESGSAGGNSGNAILRTGNSGGNSGNVVINSGTASGTRGSIELDASVINVNSTPIREVALATPDLTTDAVSVDYVYNRVGHWKRYRVNNTYFTAAATTETKNLFTLAAGESIDEIIVKHELAFVGGSIATSAIEVGKTGTNNAYQSSTSVFSAPSGTGFARTRTDVIESFDSSTQVTITLTTTGDNVNATTQGAVDVYVKIVRPAGIAATATLS